MSTVTKEDYLRRINYTGDLTISLETLRGLTTAHVAHVPFENLDMLAEKPIDLSKAGLWDKMVTRHRGGVCHELNNSMCYLLEDLGFDVERHTARIDSADDELEHTHLYVTIHGAQYLVDVGYGGHAIPPVPFEGESEGYGCFFKIGEPVADGSRPLFCKEGETDWRIIYYGYPPKREALDVLPSYALYAPLGACIFSSVPIVNRVTPTGKYSLKKETLTIQEGGRITNVHIGEESVFRAMLCTYFGIHL